MIDKGHKTNIQTYLGSCQRSMMECFTKIVNILCNILYIYLFMYVL